MLCDFLYAAASQIVSETSETDRAARSIKNEIKHSLSFLKKNDIGVCINASVSPIISVGTATSLTSLAVTAADMSASPQTDIAAKPTAKHIVIIGTILFMITVYHNHRLIFRFLYGRPINIGFIKFVVWYIISYQCEFVEHVKQCKVGVK